MRNLVVLGGSSHPDLTRSICRILTTEEYDVDISRFSNGETSIEIQGLVRDKDVFIVQSGSGHINDNFVQLLIMIAACKTASARRVTAVLPLFPYSRQPDVPHAAVATGAPSISTKKDKYTYESAPGTPKPWTKSGFDFGTPPPFNLGGNSTVGQNPASILKSIRKDNSVERSGARAAERAAERISESSSEKREYSMERALAEKSDKPRHERSCDVARANESGYKKWISQNGTLIANLLMTAGADRCVTMDLHDPQFQGFFNIPVDNLYAKPLLKHYIIDYIPDYQQCVIVSPDSGGAKRATSIADAIGCLFALIHKERRTTKPSSSSGTPGPLGTKNYGGFSSTSSVNNPHGQPMVATTMLVGDVRGRVCVLVDDLVDTSYTITRAAKLLKDQGALYVYALVTHGVLSGDAVNRIAQSSIDKLITTNSTPQKSHAEKLGDKLVVVDISRVLAEAIRRIHNGESVSMLFDHAW